MDSPWVQEYAPGFLEFGPETNIYPFYPYANLTLKIHKKNYHFPRKMKVKFVQNTQKYIRKTYSQQKKRGGAKTNLYRERYNSVAASVK